MPNSTLASLPAATTPDGTEIYYTVQGGVDKKITGTLLLTFIQATANLTFYVDAAGSDSNPGTVAEPFATLQHALDIAGSYDYNGFALVIVLNSGVNTSGTAANSYSFVYPTMTNCSQATLIGSATPANHIINLIAPGNINSTSQQFTAIVHDVNWFIDGLQINTTSGVFNLDCPDAVISFGVNGGGQHGVIISFNTGFGAGNGWNVPLFQVAGPGSRLFMYEVTFAGAGTALNDISWFSVINQPGATVQWVQPALVTFTATYHCNQLIWLRNGGEFTGFTTASMTGLSNLTALNTPGAIMSGYSFIGTDINPTDTFFNTVAFDTTCSWSTTTFTFAGVYRFMGVPVAGLPSSTQLMQSGWGLFKDTSGGGVYLSYNDAGTIKSVALSS